MIPLRTDRGDFPLWRSRLLQPPEQPPRPLFPQHGGDQEGGHGLATTKKLGGIRGRSRLNVNQLKRIFPVRPLPSRKGWISSNWRYAFSGSSDGSEAVNIRMSGMTCSGGGHRRDPTRTWQSRNPMAFLTGSSIRPHRSIISNVGEAPHGILAWLC